MRKILATALFALALTVGGPLQAQEKPSQPTATETEKGTIAPVARPVPTMTEYGLIVLALSLAGFAFVRLRRAY